MLEAGAVVVLLHDGSEVANWLFVRNGLTDLAAVDEVARLALAARQLGCALRLRGAPPALLDLFDLVGLIELVEQAQAP